ncbi:MAG: ribosome silencing factor [Bacteroidota bacterium]
MNSKELSDIMVLGMQEKKAEDIVKLDLRKVKNAVADFFIICSGNSDTQLDAIADSIEKEAKERAGETPWHREGKENREWILLDYVTVVAHVFKRERREFFALEELWGDAIITEVDSDVSLKTL